MTKSSGDSFPTLTTLGLVHSHLYQQGWLYYAAQASMGEGQLSHPLQEAGSRGKRHLSLVTMTTRQMRGCGHLSHSHTLRVISPMPLLTGSSYLFCDAQVRNRASSPDCCRGASALLSPVLQLAEGSVFLPAGGGRDKGEVVGAKSSTEDGSSTISAPLMSSGLKYSASEGQGQLCTALSSLPSAGSWAKSWPLAAAQTQTSESRWQ